MKEWSTFVLNRCRPIGCYVDYCNAHSDLKKAFCGGSTCSYKEARACEKHWQDHGRYEEFRAFNPESCGNAGAAAALFCVYTGEGQ